MYANFILRCPLGGISKGDLTLLGHLTILAMILHTFVKLFPSFPKVNCVRLGEVLMCTSGMN